MSQEVVGLHLVGAEQFGDAVVVPRQARHGVDVGLIGARRHAAQLQRVEHALAKGLIFVGAVSAMTALLDRLEHMPALVKVRSSDSVGFPASRPPRQRFSSTPIAWC